MLKNKRIVGIIALGLILNINYVNAAMAEGNYCINSGGCVIGRIESDILIDSKVKEFEDLSKVGKYLNFDYKVPDYIKDGSTVSLIRVMKADNGNSYLQLNFSTKTDKYNYGSFDNTQSLYVFDGDAVESIKNIYSDGRDDISNLKVSQTSKKLGSVAGSYVTINADIKNIDNVADGKENIKYFVFNKDGINYAVESVDFNGEDDLNTEINKIASSLKKPNELKNSNYIIDRNFYGFESLDIYDKDDFIKAVDYLGYTPKFVTSIKDDIKINSCDIFHSNSYGKEMTTFQCDYSYKNKGIVVFIQEKGNDNYRYEDIATNGYDLQKDYENNTTKKVPVEKLNWNNTDVYKYFDDCDNKYIYQWKIGDMYYFFETYFEGEKENVDDIAKVLFEA